MNCPYPDCSAKNLAPGISTCATCRRHIKKCAQCKTPGRVFANFCQACGQPIPGGSFDWTGFRGGPRRLGLNPAILGRSLAQAKLLPVHNGSLDLGDKCTALLSWDHHLIAISESGRIEVTAPGGVFARRWQAEGPICCHPCVDKGILYLGRPGGLAAYSLGALTLDSPQTAPIWDEPVSGRPVESLLVVGDRLFFSLRHTDGETTIATINLDRESRPRSWRSLYKNRHLGRLAADPVSRKVSFLSAEKNQVHLNTIDVNRDPIRVDPYPVRDVPGFQVSRSSFAVMGSKLFAILGDRDQLFVLEPGRNTSRLGNDVKNFALNRFDQRIQVETKGLGFPHLGLHEELNHMSRILGQPLILRDLIAAIGLQDSRVIVYDLKNPSLQQSLHIESSGHGITALASFGPYLAAGSARGTVALYEVVPS